MTRLVGKLVLVALVALVAAAKVEAGVGRLLRPMQQMQRTMGVRVARHAPAWHWYRQVLYGYQHPPHMRQWLCIHRYEGSWRDPAAPYWGGLQMDYGFQRTYAPHLLASKGTADHWSPLEQMWAAERAYRARGFGPWPRTARMCGLL